MKINKVKLHNFSSYEGTNEFDFEITYKEKNIVLIGGKNGAGKTSLFTAIKVALYGPLAYGYVGVNNHYISKIKDLINSKAFQQDVVESEVQITLQLKIEREIRNFVITRKWDYTNQKLTEEYTVARDGKLLNDQELSYFENYLRSIVPPDLFEFFLFDGEEVCNVFSTSAYNTYVKNAVFTLCGMDVFEIIRKFTRGYISKNNSSDDDTAYDVYETARQQVELLEEEKEQLEVVLDNLSVELEDIDVQLTELATAFKNAGGISQKEKKKLEEEFNQAEKVKTETLTNIKLFVEGLMPFYILRDFTEPIMSQLDFEEKEEIFYYVQSKLKRNTISEVLKGDVPEEKVDLLMEQLLSTFRPKGFKEDMEMMFDLSKEDIGRVNGIVSALEDFDTSAMIEIVNKRRAASERTAEINRILKNSMSEEDVNSYARKENEILKKKDELNSQLYETQHRLEELSRELQIQEQTRDKAMQSLKENAQNKHVYELSSGISAMMEQFLEEKAVSIRKSLEKSIVKKLKAIYRKNNLITHIEIGKNFDFNLYQDEEYSARELLTLYKNLGNAEFTNLIGTKGESKLIKLLDIDSINDLKNVTEVKIGQKPLLLYKKIELDRLSKGERQIFILALYWAIIEISGQNIPFVIDTPYARIDANHRREISEKFFPNISDQVIILSTDEEITEEYYKIVKPYVSKEYLLINDENENRTTITNNYFFEV
ncbi:AAA family ATPase [Lachnoanaerobaculum saburreum]|uniref:Nuclease SbcCD subunit C n=1 Tax=Lachnoanaerobaculum saburreum TaxID=467210 RepID=A0A133ZN58_9FIRM|nr:AAA family ATPase [Lachnoanaerobaculum saburreum]KXB56875.1 DNA sulfur modification protein DndD [Lachnoanaerobaculum saburreum]